MQMVNIMIVKSFVRAPSTELTIATVVGETCVSWSRLAACRMLFILVFSHRLF